MVRYHGVSMLTVTVPVELHSASKQLIEQLAAALARKLREAEVKYGYRDDWARDDWEAECRRQLMAHLAKGDPLDVALYASFMHARGWKTAAA
jgi:hypothetical protein